METKAHLQRTLNGKDLIYLIIGSVIGSGIFIVPSAVLRQVDLSLGLSLLVWLTGGVLSLLGALTYGELTVQNPHAGGIYVFIRDGFGVLPAFLYGWALFFVISSGTTATLAVAFTNYFSQIIPLNAWSGKAVSVLMIVLVTAVNVWGTRQSANLQNWTTIIKVLAILLMSVVLFWLGKNLGTATWWIPQQQSSLSIWSNFGIGMISVLWAYEGWQFACFSGSETIDPQRNYPRAFLVGLLTLIGLYMLANVAYIAALGVNEASKTDSIAAVALIAVLGKNAGLILTVAILISILGATNSTVLTTPRAFYAMAEDGVFFRRMAEISPRFKTPAIAIIASSAWAALLAATGTFERLLTYVISWGWVFYVLAGASIFVYRKKNIANRLYKVPGYPVTPILFVLSGAAVVLNVFITQPRESLIGFAIILAGIPAYFFWTRKSR